MMDFKLMALVSDEITTIHSFAGIINIISASVQHVCVLSFVLIHISVSVCFTIQ